MNAMLAKNRLRVQRQWLWSYFTGQRSSRLNPEPTQVTVPGLKVEGQARH